MKLNLKIIWVLDRKKMTNWKNKSSILSKKLIITSIPFLTSILYQNQLPHPKAMLSSVKKRFLWTCLTQTTMFNLQFKEKFDQKRRKIKKQSESRTKELKDNARKNRQRRKWTKRLSMEVWPNIKLRLSKKEQKITSTRILLNTIKVVPSSLRWTRKRKVNQILT